MAGEAYLKVAAANIRRAAEEKQREISAKTVELDRRRSEINHQIDKLNSEITRRDAEMTRSDVNEAQRMQLMHETQELRAVIEAKRHEFTQTHDIMKRQISGLESEIRGLQNTASGFERAWGV